MHTCNYIYTRTFLGWKRDSSYLTCAHTAPIFDLY